MTSTDNNPSVPSAAPQTQPPSAAKSDFVAAGEIKTILHGREKAEQERIVRWVSESLGLGAGPGGAASRPTPAPTSGPSLPPPSSEGHAHSTPAAERPKNIKAFVEEKKPKNDVQFAAVVAYYHHFEAPEANRLETITPDQVQEAARLSGHTRFKNPAVPLNNGVTLGYFDRPGRGVFRLNAVGENLVAMTLPGTDDERNGDNSSSRPRKNRPRKNHPRKPAEKQTKKPRAT